MDFEPVADYNSQRVCYLYKLVYDNCCFWASAFLALLFVCFVCYVICFPFLRCITLVFVDLTDLPSGSIEVNEAVKIMGCMTNVESEEIKLVSLIHSYNVM